MRSATNLTSCCVDLKVRRWRRPVEVAKLSRIHTPPQTVGPFFAIGLPWEHGPLAVSDDAPGALRIEGTVYDGAGVPQPLAVTTPSLPTGVVFNTTTDFSIDPFIPLPWDSARRFFQLGTRRFQQVQGSQPSHGRDNVFPYRKT